MLTHNFYKILSTLLSSDVMSSLRSVNCIADDGTTISTSVMSGSTSYQNGLCLTYNVTQSGGFQTQWGASLSVLSNNSSVFMNHTSVTFSIAKYMGVILGDGDAEVSSSDYKLSGNIITTFSASTSVINVSGADGLTIGGEYDITNTGNTAFTIREMALSRTNSLSGTPSKRIILDHTKLVTPVTINPGESKTVIYQIKFTS